MCNWSRAALILTGWQYLRIALLMLGSAILGAWISQAFAGHETLRLQESHLGKDIMVPAKGLFFRTEEGRLVAKLGFDVNGGSFLVYDIGGEPAAIMCGKPERGGLVSVSNGRGFVATLSGHDDGGGLHLMNAKRGKRAVELFVADDSGKVIINGLTGDAAVVLEAMRRGSGFPGQIEILDSLGAKPLWKAP